MKKPPIIYVLLALTLLINNVAAKNISQHLTTIVEPSPIVRIAPKYPINAARDRREGWAKLSFVISKEGDVSNVLVTETSGSADFAKSAKKAVLQWKYQPAFENGKPIEQCVNSVQMNFKMGTDGAKGVTRKFKRKYQRALEALKIKNYPQVKHELEEMLKLKERHLSESNFMHSLAANYAKDINDKSLELYHLQRLALSRTDPISAQQELATLNDIFMLEISLNNFQSAYTTYNKLIKLELAKPYLENYQKVVAKIDAFIGDGQDIVKNGDIKDNDYWYTSLVRNEFSLVNIKGALNKLEVRCANQRYIYTVEKNNTWTLPTSWRNCSIYVYGEDNTSFKLVEHSLKS